MKRLNFCTTHSNSFRERFFLNFLFLFFLFATTHAIAADPPRLGDYKTKTEAAIADSCAAVTSMYPNRPTTLNLQATYYDGAKVLTELINLYGSTSIGGYDVSTCQSQAAEINAERYIDTFPNEGGYTRFPHGLYYDYINTGDSESLAGFDAIRDGTNWDQVNVAANQKTVYARDVAYAVHMYTMAHLLGRPHANQDTLIEHFVNMSLSHLEQWHTGVFLDPDPKYGHMRQSFMVGIVMAALIEYYEWYDNDPRIPVAIKYTLDDLWEQAWWPDISNPAPSTLGDTCDYSTSYPGISSGGFWYWLEWNDTTQEYDIVANKLSSSCDVNGDTNMLIGPAYQWYALYSGDDTYQTKALEIFNGMLDMAWFGNDGRHQWEASRYMDDFIRWYRLNTGSTCSSSTLNVCENQTECENAGGNWNGVTCQYQAVSSPIYGYAKPTDTTGPAELLPPVLYIKQPSE